MILRVALAVAVLGAVVARAQDETIPNSLRGATAVQLQRSSSSPAQSGSPEAAGAADLPGDAGIANQAAPTPPPPAPIPPVAQSQRAADDAMQMDSRVIRLRVGQGRIVTARGAITKQGGVGVIAVGDPTIADFEVLPNPRMLRLTGRRPGITDLTLVTSDEQTHVYELRVEYDLTLLEAVLRQTFPSALVRITQMGDHIILEGQARDQRQLAAIDSAVRAYLQSQQTSSNTRQPPPVSDLQEALPEAQMPPDSEALLQPDEEMIRALPELTARAAGGDVATAQIINLMTLPGVQQVLLQVRIAELNRTGLREVGADTFFEFGNGNILGTKIAGAQATLKSTAATATSAATANGLTPGTSSTAFGIFPNARAEIILRVLRENSLLRVLAEPNLVAMSGHEASFLAGGEFPVPVAQGSVGVSNVTVQFKQFGVQLNFVPQILDDNVIHLEVRPEVSTIDPALGTTLVIGGTPVPGINTRRVHTTVELREGESLALAGLLQVTLDAKTSRIPGLGDLPYIGPLFSNTSHKRTEKELLVIVTPYLVAPTAADCATRLPGDDITDPNDLEFYLLNRIEGRTGREFYSTTSWDDPWHFARLIKLQRSQVCGPCGFVSQTADVEQSPTSSSVPLLVQPAGVTGP